MKQTEQLKNLVKKYSDVVNELYKVNRDIAELLEAETDNKLTMCSIGKLRPHVYSSSGASIDELKEFVDDKVRIDSTFDDGSAICRFYINGIECVTIVSKEYLEEL